MDKIKHMPWKDNLRTERFEGVAPAGFKDAINQFCNDYKERYGRYLSLTDAIIETMSHFLATNKLQHGYKKKAAKATTAKKPAVKKNRLNGKVIRTAS